MINVDISNVWGELALSDLLGAERAVSDAHLALAPGEAPWPELPESVETIQEAAARIRETSDVLVVLGKDEGCLAARGAIELFQGQDRNCRETPQVFFAGNSFSNRQWNELLKLLEGKDVSLCAVSRSGEDLECMVALRNLKWILERKYGTEESRKRIYAVTGEETGPLGRMARAEGFSCLWIGETDDSGLSAAGLLPMAAAGLDIEEILRGAREARKEYDLRSFENPVWLYAAVRHLMEAGENGLERLSSPEPGWDRLGQWWQRIFAGSGVIPVAGEGFAGPHLETVLSFAPQEGELTLGEDVKDLDGLNYLAGKDLSQIREQAALAAAEAYVDTGIPVISIDCGELREETLGALFVFFRMGASLCRKLSGAGKEEPNGREALFRLLGRPQKKAEENSSGEFTK